MADKIEMTIDAYNKNCNKFADKFMRYDPYMTHVTEIANFLEQGFSVLDIGCGPGNVAKRLCEIKDLEITGIDLSAEMLELAKKNVPQGIFYLQDSRKANFLPESFDAVVLSFCIVHLEDAEAELVLENAVKWVRKGGYMYLSFMEGKRSGFETTSFSEQPLYYHYFQEDEIRKLLELRGMECIRSVRQGYPEPDGSTNTDVFLFLRKQ